MKKVAIINTSSLSKYPDLIRRLEQEVGEVEFVKVDKDIDASSLMNCLNDASYIISGITPTFSKEFFSKNKTIEFLVRQGIGYNNVDIMSAKHAGVKVANVPGYIEKEDVAEHAVSLLMALTKQIETASIAVKNQEWNTDRKRFYGKRIHNKKVGILGFGNIGQTFSRMMKQAFECEIFVYDPYMNESQVAMHGAKKVELDMLLGTCDFISLHINLTDETRHIINEKKISLMKNDAILINTARGELVDERAIANALNQDQLGAYGCDVIENEPIQKDNPLLFTKHVLITPHIAVFNEECNYEMSQSVVNDVILVHNGNEPLNLLNK